MNKTRAQVAFALLILLVCGAAVGYAAIPQNTIRQDQGIVSPTLNATLGYWVGPNQIVSAARAATFNSVETAYLNLAGPTPLLINGTIIEPDALLYPVTEASYVIWADNSTGTSIYYAKNGMTGQIQFSGTNPTTVIHAARDVLPFGGVIYCTQGEYYLISQIIMNVSDITLIGSGPSTQFILDPSIVVPVYACLIEIQGPVSNVTVSDLLVDANGIYYYAIGTTVNETDSVTNLNILRVHAYNGYDDNIQISGSGVDGALVRDCWAIRDRGDKLGSILAGIEIEWNAQNVVIENNYVIMNMATTGGNVYKGIDNHNEAVKNLIIRNNYVYWSGIGIGINGLVGTPTYDVTVEENTIAPHPDMHYGIDVSTYCENVLINNNKIRMNMAGTSIGIRNQATGASIFDNLVDNRNYGGVIGGSTGIYNTVISKIDSNTILGGARGIDVRGTSQSINNYIDCNSVAGSIGIQVAVNVLGSFISNNQIFNCVNYGIEVLAGTDDTEISCNYISTIAGRGIRIWEGSTRNIHGNKIYNTNYAIELKNAQVNLFVQDNSLSGTVPINKVSLSGSYFIRNNVGYIESGEIRSASGSLTAGNANAIAFAWNNPHTQDILIKKVVIEVTTAGGTVGSHLDAGIADDAAGTNRGTEFFNDLLLNNVQINDSWVAGDGGTQTKWVFAQDSASATDDWIVGQILDANAAVLVGKYYIEYIGR